MRWYYSTYERGTILSHDGHCPWDAASDPHGGPRSDVLTEMRDPHAVATIVEAMRQSHGDDHTRLLLRGMSAEALIGALLHAQLSERDVARLITVALESGDFEVWPDFTTRPSHLKFIYDPLNSLRVVDIVMLTESETFS